MISMVFTPFFYQSMVLLVWGWLKGGTLGHCIKLKSWRFFFFFLTHWEETFLAGSKAPDTLCASPTPTPKKVILHNVMCEDFFLEEVTEARCPKIPYSNTGAKSTSPHLQRCREPGDELQQCLPSRVEIGNQYPKLFFKILQMSNCNCTYICVLHYTEELNHLAFSWYSSFNVMSITLVISKGQVSIFVYFINKNR